MNSIRTGRLRSAAAILVLGGDGPARHRSRWLGGSRGTRWRQIRSEDDLVTEIDFERVNSATGPVAVRDAEPGDSLVVDILDVSPIEWGVATLIPGFGQLIDKVEAPVTRVFRVEDGMVEMNERVRFPARPMVGVVGVATGGETMTNGLAGPHGGNLDNHMHGPGSRMYFPVRQEGGLFAVGDMHASMGDGEICFTGVGTPSSSSRSPAMRVSPRPAGRPRISARSPASRSRSSTRRRARSRRWPSWSSWNGAAAVPRPSRRMGRPSPCRDPSSCAGGLAPSAPSACFRVPSRGIL